MLNGVDNGSGAANLNNGDLPHKRLSTSSTNSNHSYDSQSVEYAIPKTPYNHHIEEDKHIYAQKPTNPLFGVNAAANYSPAPVKIEEERPYDRISLPNGIRKDPEGQINDAFRGEETVDGRQEVVMKENQIAISDGGTATYTTDNNGKINVHVTVMINAGNYMHPYDLNNETINIIHGFHIYAQITLYFSNSLHKSGLFSTY